MLTKHLTLLLLILILIPTVLFIGCAQKIVIPDYETAKEQYLYAMKLKLNTMKGFDKKTRENQLNRIETAFMRVIKNFPDDNEYTPVVYINLGETYNSYEKPLKAIAMFSTAIHKYPGQEDIQLFGHYGLGISYDKIGEYAKAKEQFKICIDQFGDNPRSTFQKIVEQARRRYGVMREK